MYFVLKLKEDKEKGFLVAYIEHGTYDYNEMYSSTSRQLALNEYYKILRRIDSKSFRILEQKENHLETYTIFECLLQFVLFPAKNENLK